MPSLHVSKNFQFHAGEPINEVVVGCFMDHMPGPRVSFPGSPGGMWGPQLISGGQVERRVKHSMVSYHMSV